MSIIQKLFKTWIVLVCLLSTIGFVYNFTVSVHDTLEAKNTIQLFQKTNICPNIEYSSPILYLHNIHGCIGILDDRNDFDKNLLLDLKKFFRVSTYHVDTYQHITNTFDVQLYYENMWGDSCGSEAGMDEILNSFFFLIYGVVIISLSFGMKFYLKWLIK